MALVAISGLWMPGIPNVNPIPALASALIDASGEKVAWIGRVWNKDRATKSIRTIGFLPGAITPNSSTMRISLQDLDLTTGNPARPDGVVDQSVTFADTAPTASTWYQTANLDADRSVAFGELLAVVLDYSTFGAGTAFNVQNITSASSNLTNSSFCSLLSGAGPTWAAQSVVPNIILGFTDSTFGTLGEPEVCFPVSATNSVNLNTGSTPDEIALAFTVPMPCKCDGAWMIVNANVSGRDYNIVLYQDTTVLATGTFDAESLASNATARVVTATFAEATLAAGTQYYLALTPTTTGNVTGYNFDVSAAGHMDAHAGGQNWTYSTRTDAGAWAAATTTRRLYAGIMISAVDDGTTTGGFPVTEGPFA